MHTWLMVMLRQRQRNCNTINSNQQYKHISYVFFYVGCSNRCWCCCWYCCCRWFCSCRFSISISSYLILSLILTILSLLLPPVVRLKIRAENGTIACLFKVNANVHIEFCFLLIEWQSVIPRYNRATFPNRNFQTIIVGYAHQSF